MYSEVDAWCWPMITMCKTNWLNPFPTILDSQQRPTMETLSILCSANSIYQKKWLLLIRLGSLWTMTKFWNILASLEDSRKKYFFGFHSSRQLRDLLWSCSPSPVYYPSIIYLFQHNDCRYFRIRDELSMSHSKLWGKQLQLLWQRRFLAKHLWECLN